MYFDTLMEFDCQISEVLIKYVVRDNVLTNSPEVSFKVKVKDNSCTGQSLTAILFRNSLNQMISFHKGFPPFLTVHLFTPGRGGTLGISGWGCAARTLEPLAYTRASFSWILLPYTTVNS